MNLEDKFTLGIGQPSVASIYKNPAVLVNIITGNLYILGGIILFFMVILAGFKMMSDTAKGKEEGLNILKTALMGLVVMFVAYWIVQIVTLVTGVDLNP